MLGIPYDLDEWIRSTIDAWSAESPVGPNHPPLMSRWPPKLCGYLNQKISLGGTPSMPCRLSYA